MAEEKDRVGQSGAGGGAVLESKVPPVPGSVVSEGMHPASNDDDSVSEIHEETTAVPESGGCCSGEKQPPVRSRPSSVFSRTQSAVPKSQRRGIFPRYVLIPEVERPREYTNKTKWGITAIIALAAAAAPLGSGIFYPCLTQIAEDLNTSKSTANLSVAFYMLAMSIFPPVVNWGRRTVYVISFTLYVVFVVLSAVSVNITMLIVVRVLSGGAAASVQAVGAGTIADIWDPAERGGAMGIFYLGPLVGPLFAPVIGGALAEGFGWRSTMWFLVIFGGLMLVSLLFCLPETLARKQPPPAPRVAATAAADDGHGALARVTTAQSVREQTRKTGVAVRRFVLDPLQVLLYLRFPAVAVAVYSASVAFGALYILNISIQSAFGNPPYGFSEVIVGVLYLPLSFGYILGSLLGGRWIDRIMAQEARRAGRYDRDGKLLFLPEDRMRENMWLAATLYPGALIWFGWTVDKGVHWIVPAIACFFFGFGSMLVFGAVTTVLTEFMAHRTSGGVAVNNFIRNIFSCVGVVVTQPLIGAMGYGWLATMVALFAWITGNGAIWALRRWSPKWRVQMDKKINQQS